MSFRLKINNKIDEKLLENFPADPYYDVVIITASMELELSYAYLSIDSQYFADLPSDSSEIDLSHLNEQFLISVLRAIYGGELQATSVADLEEIYKIIDFLRIDEFKNSIADNLRKMHELKRDTSPLNTIEMIEFCVRTGILKELVMQFHFQSKLKVLESSKNYLQLGKLSDKSLNAILLEFSAKEGEKGDNIINHILQNYFNRKSYRAADYFTETQLAPLRFIWEKFHHKINLRGPKLQKTTSIQELKETVPITLQSRNSENISKFGRLANIPAISTQSVNITGDLFKSEKMGDEALYDLRIQALTKDLDNRNRKIESLQSELKQLQEIKAKRDKAAKQMQTSIDDVTLLKNVVRSRRTKEEQLRKGDNSVNEFAYDNIKRVVEHQREGKLKLVSKNSMAKKIFN